MSKNNKNAAEMQQEQEENIPQEQQPEVQEQQPEVKVTKPEEPYQKTVKVKIPRVKGQREDVMVGVNGKFWQIKRGVYVEVPMPVYEVLQHQEEMEAEASELEDQLEEQLKQMKN